MIDGETEDKELTIIADGDEEAPFVKKTEDERATLRAELKKAQDLAAAEAARADDADRRANDSAKKANQSGDTALARHEEAIDARIKSSKSAADTAQAAWEAAMSEGDFKLAALHNREMTRQEQLGVLAEAEKKGLENWKKQREAQRAQGDTLPDSDREAYIQTKSPATQAWLRDHPEFFTDKGFQDKATRAHHAALAKGIRVDTERYFEFVDQRLGLQPENEGSDVTVVDGEEEDAPPLPKTPQKKRGAGNLASPPSNGGGGAGGGRAPQRGEIRLNKLQAEAARNSFPEMTPQDAYKEYYKNMTAEEISKARSH